MLKGSSARLMDCHVVSNTVTISGAGGGVFVFEGEVANCLIEYNVSKRATVSHSCGQGVAGHLSKWMRLKRARMAHGGIYSYRLGIYLYRTQGVGPFRLRDLPRKPGKKCAFSPGAGHPCFSDMVDAPTCGGRRGGRSDGL